MDEMKVKLASALSLRPLGAIAMADLARHYKQINKEKLDFKELGFESLQKLLEAMPDTFQVKYDKKISDYRVFLVNYEVNEAIEKEINNQSQSASSLLQDMPTSYSTRRYDEHGDLQSDSFMDRTRTSEDRPVNRLRERPIPTAFRGYNDWDLYLQNFPNDTKESDLMDVFKSFGCTRVRIKKKRENETLFGFATFRDYSEAEMAYLTLDGTEFKGRGLNIQFAKSSIASEDEVRARLEKTQFTAEVTSTRRRNFSSDEGGSLDRREVTQPDHPNWRRSQSQLDPHCHSPLRKDDSSWLPWQPFAAPGYITIGNETTTRREGGTTSSPTSGIMTSNTNQNQVAQGGVSCINGETSSGTEDLGCVRKRRVQSNSKRTFQVFTDIEVDGEQEEEAEAVANVKTEREEANTRQFDPWGKQDNPGQLYSSQSNDNTNSGRTFQMFAESKVNKKESNSKVAHESLDKDTAENNDNEEQLDSVESKEKTERPDTFSSGEAPGQLGSSTSSERHCTAEMRSNDSEEISSQSKIRDKVPVVKHSTFNRDSEAGIKEEIRDGEDKNRCPFLNINHTSDISLSEKQNDSNLSSDNSNARLEKTDSNIELPVSIGRRNLWTEKSIMENKGDEENSSILSHGLKTASDIVPRWLRVYVRDDILLVEDIQKWTKIYSRNGLHLGQLKYQCRPLTTQFKNSSLAEFPKSSINIANSLKPETETVSSESLSVEADTLLTSNTSKKLVASLVGRCCEEIPETMDVRFLQKMLDETRIKQGFLSQRDLPDELDLMVIHVCNSNHFWGSVINSGVFMDEYEDLFQMMNDIAVKARPEFRLDKARVEDKRAGVMYQETDWCRVWIRSQVRDSEVEVFYVDFGNSEFRSVDDLWVLPRKAWHLRPMVLPFHLTGSLAKKTLFEMVNTKITVKLVKSQPAASDFVVAVRPYKELDSVDIE